MELPLAKPNIVVGDLVRWDVANPGCMRNFVEILGQQATACLEKLRQKRDGQDCKQVSLSSFVNTVLVKLAKQWREQLGFRRSSVIGISALPGQ